VRGALAHYDSTSSAVADVTCGEDEHGIWVAGWVRPGTSDEMVTALRASAVSGDWRSVDGNLELIAVLAVNVPGFGIPRVRIAAAGERQISLVASGIVEPTEPPDERIDYEALARIVAAEVVSLSERKARLAALSARVEGAEGAV